MTREREFKPAQVCKGKGPKVATCEARFFQNICQIQVFSTFLGRDKTFQASPSKGHLRQSGQNPRSNEIFSPKMAIFEAHFGKLSAKPGF